VTSGRCSLELNPSDIHTDGKVEAVDFFTFQCLTS